MIKQRGPEERTYQNNQGLARRSQSRRGAVGKCAFSFVLCEHSGRTNAARITRSSASESHQQVWCLDELKKMELLSLTRPILGAKCDFVCTSPSFEVDVHRGIAHKKIEAGIVTYTLGAPNWSTVS